ncbi:MAG: hypothetical protein ACXV5Q_05520 [Frankiaceae bacterium]
MTRSPRFLVPALLVVGLLLTQAAWMLALPAFRGVDEIDHAYRAASLARGEVAPSGIAAKHGRGELVMVPQDLTRAAGPECRALKYDGPDNCRPSRPGPHGTVWAATSASRYSPAFYWVIGKAAEPFRGTTALVVMRAVAGLLCAAFFGLAGWVVTL